MVLGGYFLNNSPLALPSRNCNLRNIATLCPSGTNSNALVRATNKYLGSVVDENTFLGFKSPVLNLTSDELKTLKAFNAEIISGTAGQEAFEKHLSKSRD